MTLDEQIIQQIIKGFANGTVNLDAVPDLKTMIENAAAKQMATVYDTTDWHKKQEDALQQEVAWLQQQAQQQMSQINPTRLAESVMSEIHHAQADLNEQQEDFNRHTQVIEAESKEQLIRRLIPVLSGFAVCLLLVTIIFFILERLIYKGIWNGWGLNKLVQVVVALHTAHPYAAAFLGLFGTIFIVLAILGSFWLLVQSVQKLTDFKPSKLLFWRKKNSYWN